MTSPEHVNAPFAQLHKGKFDSGLESALPANPEGVGDAYFAIDTNKLYIANSTGTSWIGYSLPVAGGISSLSEIVSPQVIAGNPTSVTISSIPGTYYELMLLLKIRSAAAVTQEDLSIRFNGDTNTNYNYSIDSWQGSGATLAESITGTSIVIPQAVVGNNADAQATSNVILRIPNYASTANMKNVEILTNMIQDNTTTTEYTIDVGTSEWDATPAAITSVTFFTSSSAAISGVSSYALYGIGDAL